MVHEALQRASVDRHDLISNFNKSRHFGSTSCCRGIQQFSLIQRHILWFTKFLFSLPLVFWEWLPQPRRQTSSTAEQVEQYTKVSSACRMHSYHEEDVGKIILGLGLQFYTEHWNVLGRLICVWFTWTLSLNCILSCKYIQDVWRLWVCDVVCSEVVDRGQEDFDSGHSPWYCDIQAI